MSVERHQLEIDTAPSRVLAAVAGIAEDWGGQWSSEGGGGRLILPVVAGLRRGVLDARLAATPAGDGACRVTLEGETLHWQVHRSAAAVLVMGALGALPVLLWPLSSDLLALAPAGLVLLFLAWFMVVSRLRTAGGAEFLEAVRQQLAAPDDEE